MPRPPRLLSLAASMTLLAAPLLAKPASAATTDLTEDASFAAPFNNFYKGYANVSESLSSPAYGDVTGNGQAEIIVGGMDGRLSIFTPTGSLVGRHTIGPGAIHSAPSLADVDGDGVLDIAVATTHGDVVVLRGNGSEIIRKRTCTQAGKPCDVYSTPAIGDIDNDGKAEIVVTSDDHYLHAWNNNGSNVAGFPVQTYGTTWASPTLADVDDDGYAEIIVAVDINYGGNGPVGCATWGSFIRAYEHNGAVKWTRCVPGEIITSSPAVADIDADGKLEIAIGSGMFFRTKGEAAGPSRLMRVLDATNGNVQPGWPVDTGSLNIVTPALGNLDDDPQLEIVTTIDDGFVKAYEHDGTAKWSTCVTFSGSPTFACPFPNFNAMGSSVSIADVDNDGQQEVVAYLHTDVQVLSGANGALENKLFTNGRYVPRGQPTIVDHKGEATIIVQQVDEVSGAGPSTGDRLVVRLVGTGKPLGTADWPMFGNNPARTGSTQSEWEGAVWIEPWLQSLYEDLLGRSADQGGIDFWTGRLGSNMNKHQVALAFATSDEWLGVVVDDLYDDVLGRAPDAGGRAYWIQQLKNGMPAAQVVSTFFASDEYFASVGGTNAGFVDSVYAGILRRGPDAGGRQFWIGQLDAGVPRGNLSVQVFRSYESGGLRVDGLYADLLRRSPDAGGRDYWANYLQSGDEIALAAQIVTSAEYIDRGQIRFG